MSDRVLYPSAVQELTRAMQKIGAISVKAEYHGGNDEGFIEPITITYSDGRIMAFEEMYQQDGKDSDVSDVITMICVPIEGKYGTWAGDFDAAGYCSFSVGDDDVTCQGQETDWVDVEWT